MPLLITSILKLNGVRVFTYGFGIDKVNSDLLQLLLVPKVYTFDVVLDVLAEDLPIVLK